MQSLLSSHRSQATRKPCLHSHNRVHGRKLVRVEGGDCSKPSIFPDATQAGSQALLALKDASVRKNQAASSTGGTQREVPNPTPTSGLRFQAAQMRFVPGGCNWIGLKRALGPAFEPDLEPICKTFRGEECSEPKLQYPELVEWVRVK